jgi:hypothetical protein
MHFISLISWNFLAKKYFEGEWSFYLANKIIILKFSAPQLQNFIWIILFKLYYNDFIYKGWCFALTTTTTTTIN